MVASLFSYVAGLFRDLILSYFFGATGATDVYYTAFLIPDLIFNLTVAGVLGGVFIPIFRQKYLDDEDGAAALGAAFLASSQVLVLGVSLLAMAFMPWLVDWVFAAATPPQKLDIVNLSRIMLLSPIFMALSNTLGSVLMSFKHYLSYALSPGLYNLGIIAGIFFFHEQYGIYSAAFGVVIGLVLHLAIRFWDMKSLKFSFNFAKAFNFKTDGLWEIYKLSIPKTLGLVMFQLSAWVYNILGYSMVEGSISAYNYARNIQSFAVSLFGIAVATAVFPFLVDGVKSANKNDLDLSVRFTFLQILFYTLPSAAGLIVLSGQVTSVLFGRGAFDASALALTSGMLFFFAISVPFESLVHLLSRVYYAFKNTWIPVLINLLFLIISVVVSVIYAEVYGPNVFAISFSIGCIVQVVLLMIWLRKYVNLDFVDLAGKSILILMASGIMGICVKVATNYSFGNEYLDFVCYVAFGVGIYFGFARIFGILNLAGLDRFSFNFKKK
jgi:putative peptidoglycan lipid II flippase